MKPDLLPRGAKNLNRTAIGRMVLEQGHKALWVLPDGRVRVDTKWGVPVYVDDPFKVVATLKRAAQTSADNHQTVVDAEQR